jgi:hypothetical protein
VSHRFGAGQIFFERDFDLGKERRNFPALEAALTKDLYFPDSFQRMMLRKAAVNDNGTDTGLL